MTALAERYQPRQVLPREIVGSKAFPLEYKDNLYSKTSIQEDIVSYLGEYRFEIPKYEYSLFYSRNDTDRISVFAKDGESMTAKSRRAIAERKQREDPTHREENETVGLQIFEQQLLRAKDGDTLFWASPPGPEEEGYGNYGFVYSGKIHEGTIRMAALRVENPTIEQYNRAMSILTGSRFNFVHADDFLRSPHIVSASIPDSYIEHILKQEFFYVPDEQKQKEFESIIRVLEPLIDRAVFAIQNGSKEGKLTTFYALENYAIELRDHHRETTLKEGVQYLIESTDLDHIISSRSYQPPMARGSCGSTEQSNMLFSGDSVVSNVLTTDKYGSREFNCPKCNKKNIRPMNELLEKCQHCGSTEVACEENSGEESYQEAA